MEADYSTAESYFRGFRKRISFVLSGFGEKIEEEVELQGTSLSDKLERIVENK